VGGGNQNSLSSPIPAPHFRNRQVVTSAIVWDGQTIVLGGLISEDVTKVKDKVPVLGDLPLLGRFFRSEASQTRKKNLVIFVTPTIIDPAGHRLHSEEEMPFAQTSLPTQPPSEK
jgi:general secretion pathway protein D